MYFDFSELEKVFNKKKASGSFSNTTGNAKNILPLDQKSTPAFIKDSPGEFLGEVIRTLAGVTPEKEVQSDSQQLLIEEIVDKVDFNDNSDAKEFLYAFLEDYLNTEQSEDTPQHPHLYIYNKMSEKEEKEKKKYAKFIVSTLFDFNQDAKKVFLERQAENLLTQLILQALPDLKESQYNDRTSYSIVVPSVQIQFIQDFNYLSGKQDHFLKNMYLLTQYYLFTYILQFYKQAQSFGALSSDKITPMPFVLDWETGVGSYRDAVKEFALVKDHTDHIFPHMHCLAHLSHQHIENDEPNEVKSYDVLLQELSILNEEEQKAEKKKLVNWITEYRNAASLGNVNIKENADFAELFKGLFDAIKLGMNEGVRKKIGAHLINIGSTVALKSRGRHGKVLSLSQDLLLLLAGVCVKDEKIQLNQLFVELSKRGISFDHYSREEVVKLLDHLNYIEKKSDSGDAQYVKPIF